MRSRRGFTLIELLVVVAILALLMSILLPSLRRARDVAKMTVCLSNQRQIGLAIYLYLEKYNNQMLPNVVPADAGKTDNWDKALARDMGLGTVTNWGGGGGRPDILLCPSSIRPGKLGAPPWGSYGLHINIARPGHGYDPNNGKFEYYCHWSQDFEIPASHQGPRQPATLPVVFDASRAISVLSYNCAYDCYVYDHRHVAKGDGSNFLFADWHAEYLRADKSVLGPYFNGATELVYPQITW